VSHGADNLIHQKEMTCQELVELVTEYLEGALPDSDRRRFDVHLSACPHCVAYIEQMRTTVRLTGRLGEEHLQDEAIEEVLAAFQDWKRRVQ
jgi:anti-sigma factor RsiW